VAAIGYCFGGTACWRLARKRGSPARSHRFPWRLEPIPNEGPDNIKGKILVCQGGADPMVGPQAIANFQQEMIEARRITDEYLRVGSDARLHQSAADQFHIRESGYNAQADKRSWMAMNDFFCGAVPITRARGGGLSRHRTDSMLSQNPPTLARVYPSAVYYTSYGVLNAFTSPGRADSVTIHFGCTC